MTASARRARDTAGAAEGGAGGSGRRLDRRTVLIGTPILFILATCSGGADRQMFLAVRSLTGALQGLFITAALVTGWR